MFILFAAFIAWRMFLMEMQITSVDRYFLIESNFEKAFLVFLVIELNFWSPTGAGSLVVCPFYEHSRFGDIKVLLTSFVTSVFFMPNRNMPNT